MTFEELRREANIESIEGIVKVWYSNINKAYLKPLENNNCIYMLVCNDEIVYIGSSTNIVHRLLDHKYKLSFDYAYIGIPEENTLRDMLFMESYFIGIAEPILNFTDYTCKKFKSKSIDYIKQHIKTAC